MNSIRENLKPRGHMGKTVVFDSEMDYNCFLKDFLSPSYMEENFYSWSTKQRFDILSIKLRDFLVDEIIKKNIVDKEDFKRNNCKLELTHLYLSEHKKNLDETEQNEISIDFYDISSDLKNEYYKFLEESVSKLFNEPIYYQNVPTFRFHFPNQKGYEWEDRYHTDVMLGHPPYELNLWLPFTKVYDSNSMRLTSLKDSLNFIKTSNYNFESFASGVQYDKNMIQDLRRKSQPLNMNYGEFIIFDPRCLHCTQYNSTNETRISMDVRIITESNLQKYSREYRTTGRKKMLFQPGHYFSKQPIL